MIYKNVKFHDFHEAEGKYSRFRLTKDGTFIYSGRRDLGIIVVLDKKQDHSHLKTNNIVGDLVVLETIAFLTNVKDQIVHTNKEVSNKDSEYYCPIYPSRCEIKHCVFNTKKLGEEVEVCIKEEEVLLSAEKSDYKFEKIAKPIADYFLGLNTSQSEMYVALPKITKIDAGNITTEEEFKYTFLQKVWVKDGKCFESYIEDFDTVFLREQYIPSWLCNKFQEVNTLSEKTLRDESITETRVVPEMDIFDFAKKCCGYKEDDDFDICCMHGKHFTSSGPSEKSLMRLYGEDYKKYLADKTNWIEKTFLIERKVWTEQVIEIKYKGLPVYFKQRSVFCNGWSEGAELLEQESDIDKANEALYQIYEPLMAPKGLV